MNRQRRIKLARPSTKSFLAFFLLPQFWRSFGHFSYLRPIFIQNLALMLAQSGLIPVNHPATRYGIKTIDGKKITAFGLLGESWFHLRTRPDMGLYQWSIFSTIIMMFVVMFSALATGVFYYAGLLTQQARAQLFNVTGQDTSFGNIPGFAATPENPLFDRSEPDNPDLAIMILDKVLRQGAMESGGSMQDGIGMMFGTYSTAILVLASLYMFWSITVIVVSTAQTGKLGGGRHNMFWTPVRFIFVLGLLIPIGGTFNTGQYIIMRFAEWGSNLGTNIWAAYLTGTSDVSFLAGNISTSASSATQVLEPVMDIMLCMTSHNMQQEAGLVGFNQGTYGAWTFDLGMAPMLPVAGWGNPHPSFMRPIIDEASRASNAPNINFYFGTELEPGACGSITLANPAGHDIINQDPNYTEVLVGEPYSYLAAFQRDVREAELAALNNMLSELRPMSCHLASLEERANPAEYSETCPATTYVAPCNTNPGGHVDLGGRAVDSECLNDIVQQYIDDRNAGIQTAMDNHLVTHVTGATPGDNSPHVDAMIEKGWAGIGGWYYEIATINRKLSSTIVPDLDADLSESGGFRRPTMREGWQLMRSFQTNTITPIWNRILGTFPIRDVDSINIDAGHKVLKWLLFMMYDSEKGPILVELGVYGSNTHPMAMLARAGGDVIDHALFIYGTIAFFSLLAMTPVIGGAIEALMMGGIGKFIGMIAGVGFVPGLLLLYYVPLIPWVKAMFAVVAWIVAVIEAVITMPLVALTHIRTTGHGIMGPMAQGAYIAWLNILLRPGLVVIGFIMGALIFEAMILVLNDTFHTALANMGPGGFGVIDQIINTYIYVFTAYALTNACFKLVDLVPNSTMKWLGGPKAESFNEQSLEMAKFGHQIMGELTRALGSVMPQAAAAGGISASGGARGAGAGGRRAARR
ncbi:MAG: hypothetical protein EA357_01545 [Micavibrio sp.]|nr:MAG: hypothetical protein EA357_01545 [Micavibrio sp.]